MSPSQDCQCNGGRLATINDKVKLDLVQSKINCQVSTWQDKKFWIGVMCTR